LLLNSLEKNIFVVAFTRSAVSFQTK